MNNQRKKILVPIIITIVVVLYYVAYFSILIFLIEGIIKYILGIIPLLLSFVMINVCLERIREIKGGEEDDISKY